MNDCIDERVVDGGRLGNDSGDSFGIRIQDASISGKEQKGTSSSSPADSFWMFTSSAGFSQWHQRSVVVLCIYPAQAMSVTHA